MDNKKKKNSVSMEDEDRAFWEAAMKDPKIRKQIEEDEKKRDNMFREQAKRLIKKRNTEQK